MAVVWMFVCVLTVCLARDLSPDEISLKKAFAFFQSMESMLDQDAREVQLEPNDVEAEASGHQNPEQKPQSVNEPTNVQNQVVTRDNGTAGAVQNRVVIRGNSTAGRDLKGVIIGGDSTTEDVQNRVFIRGNATAGGAQNLVIIKDKAKLLSCLQELKVVDLQGEGDPCLQDDDQAAAGRGPGPGCCWAEERGPGCCWAAGREPGCCRAAGRGCCWLTEGGPGRSLIGYK